MMIYDFAIVGGGIVGLAAAREILRARPGATIIILEKESAVARHQTGHNSGVIHAGIYYAPGSLKARFCREGAAATKAFCAEQGIKVENCGKLLVATNDRELAQMEALFERAKQNGIAAERIDAAGLRRLEPNITGTGALRVASTAIVDYKLVAAAFAQIAAEKGANLQLGTEIVAIREDPDAIEVSTVHQTWRARFLIVCAGLQSDRLAKLAGLKIDHRIVPFRGEFYTLPQSRTGLITHLIYPIPDPSLPFVGIHLTRTIDGRIIVGPNAVLGFAREGYKKLSFRPQDVIDYLAFPGFWQVARTHFASGVEEMRNSFWKRGYLAQCRKYCPGLSLADLQPGLTGIRAQAVLRDGTLVHDFLFAETARMLHVCNAPSPAATSAIPIARMIAEKVLTRFERD
ncbi:L-2-hydroxyglutarate oxidase [Methylocapsa sp. D3K7]|uniref:L-2-hydroxyglutarate oxidase n=1 Tax=Methylocapsa sp. D3K7 TaxID=3041435 RepID=UPI00244EACCC|nr:L-2-hydroxyglutarate oxidase [Methylocapsa sp. D3K7]WGJ16454.1 L-2-hydroxyglutarate oxidase [Methylocapsa sp. D3K7]